MRWGGGVLLGLLLLLGLLAWPPLLREAVDRALPLLGLEGRVGAVSGHLLLGLRLRGVALKGEGLTLHAEEVALTYDFLGLLRRELPLSLTLRKATLRPTWEALLPEKPAPPPALRVVFRSLRLEEVEVVLPRGQRLFLPPLRLTLLGENPYRFVARLPGGSFLGEARALSRDLASWEVAFRGEVRGLAFFYPGLEGGHLRGALHVGPSGLEGQARLEGGAVEVVGFPLTGVQGEIALGGGRVEARLRGRGLEGPLEARVQVDLKAPRYRFQVEGRPGLPALARHFGLTLPVQGDGRLVLWGEGWEALRLSGAFQGEGRLLGEPFRHRGRLSFDRVFRLEAEAKGALFDRTYALGVALEGGRYQVRYRDDRGSALALLGQGSRYQGAGRAAWPRPLEGMAEVRFFGEGSRYRVAVEGPGARLPLFPPLELSGEVTGEGGRVEGRVGPVRLAGTWADLALRLEPTPLRVGQLEGEGRVRGGRLLLDLRYASPYTAFPLRVRQGEGGFLLESPYGRGSYRKGVFALRLQGLPVRLLEEMHLFGEAVYREGALSGALRLSGRYLEIRAGLRGLGADLEGRLSTPLGALPLSGAYDPEAGLRLRAGGLALVYREGVSLKGEAALGPLRVAADLAYGEGFSGTALLKGPWGLEGRLWGKGRRLFLRLTGPVEGEGEVYPELGLSGRLLPPWPEGFSAPPLAFRLTREALELPGVGRVRLFGGYPFLLDLPFRYRGVEGRLSAQGDLEGGRVRLSTPLGELRGEGAWRALALKGKGSLAALGPWTLRGRADLLALAYRGEAALPRAGLLMELSGKGKALRFTGQAPGLLLFGGYGEGLALRLSARGYDLAPFGLPARLWGGWGLEGGRLWVETPYGQAVLEGKELLRARLLLAGPYLEGKGEASLKGLSLRLLAHYRAGGVALEAEGEGGGPWGALRFLVAGEARAPLLNPVPFRGAVEVERGVRYRLEGPVALFGEGARYQGEFRLPFALLGKEGEVWGQFRGEGLRLEGAGEGVYGGLPFAFRGGYGEGPFLEVRYAGGEAEFAKSRLHLALEEVAPLARVLGLGLSGAARGQVDLAGEGEGEARLLLSGEPLEARYRGTTLEVRLPRREAGLAWDWREGGLKGLLGLSGEGRLLWGREASGRFAYRGAALAFAGPWEAVALEGRYAQEGLGTTSVQALLDLKALRGEGEVRHASAYALGEGRFRFAGSRYQLEGHLRSLAYLEQEGPFRLAGEGLKAALSWEAPLALRAAYGEGLALALQGEGEVRGVRVRADLAYGPGGYRGRLWASGRGLLLEGEGAGALFLRLSGEGLRAEARLRGLALEGEGSFARALGQARLEAAFRFQGLLPHLEAEGEGRVAGAGEGIPFRFAYRFRGGASAWEGLSLRAEADGVNLALEAGGLSLKVDRDLAPFGVPLRLKAQGEGPLEAPIALALEGKEGALKGRAWPLSLRAALEGEVLGERVAVNVAGYGEGLLVRFLGPHLFGEARYGKGLSGRLALRYPLLEGALGGEVDLGAGRFRLFGEGPWEGAWTGGFCLPEPLGACSGLALEASGRLAYRGVALEGRYRYDGAEVRGEGRLATPYGALRLLGRGLGLDLEGEGLPLRGRLDLQPFRLAYRYAGALPLGLGELRAEGVYPGAWLLGTYRYGEVALALEGLPGFRVGLRGGGVRGGVGPEGVSLALEGFRYGPLRLSGRAEGPFSRVGLDLVLAAFGREARAVGGLGEAGLSLAFSGDLEGQVAWKEAWSGRVAFREGWVALSGRGVPELQGEVLGEGVRLRWPRLEVGGLRVDLAARKAEGEARLLAPLVPGGVEAQGEGGALFLAYRVPGLGLPLEGRVDLWAWSLSLTSPEGEGALRYAGGRVEGRLALRPFGLPLVLEGEGSRVAFWGTHPASPWWAAGEGRLEGEVDLQGGYRLGYRAGPQALTLTGRLGEAFLAAEGPYLSGRLAYPGGGDLAVDLPLPPLDSRFRGRIFGAYRVEGLLEGGVGRIQVAGRLFPLEGELSLQEAALEDFLARYAPYLKGRVSGRLAFKGPRAEGSLFGRVEVAGTVLPLAFFGEAAPGRVRGEGRLGESGFRVDLEGERLELAASPRGFPLHLLLQAVAGPLEGEAYWTGQVHLRLPLADPGRGEGALLGENLVFRGGGDELKGKAVLRYRRGRLDVDYLRLSGRGLWEGRGYWSPEGSDLYLSLKDTVFTPVLRVIPALKAYRPEGSGTLEVRLQKGGFQIAFGDFRFRLGPVAGYLPRGLLSLDGGARAEGELALTAPFPGRARLGLEGGLESFRVTAKGTLSLPGLKEDTPLEAAFRYPAATLELRLGGLEAQGTLFPLRLAGYGRLPLAYPQYYLEEGLLDVKGFFLYEERGTYHLTGNAEILRARLAIPEAGARTLSGEGLKVAEKPAPLPLVFDGVRLYAERGVLVQESLAQGELKGEVYLGGSYQDPFLTGTVQALWGNFRLWDTLFALDPEGSLLRFAPDRGLLPEFVLKARGETRGYRVFLEASGAFVREGGRVRVRLTPHLTASPPLSEPEIYALLALGTPDPARLAETLPQTALGAALENLVLGQLEREVGRALGLDRFQVQVPAFQGGALEDTQFSIGKYLSPELFLGYQVDLRGVQTFSAQYRRDGLTFALSSTFLPGDGRFSRFALALGYDVTEALGLRLTLEANDAVRFGVGAAYRW
ncbi:translocation/assembly module TamB domain-containing protein [Thermus islandicus]|uniref:translocation/assembly module TamB domain-containing protein n=1 Tax=Thermus islandicus TaxID=540988 RepID=UPI0003B5A6E3|nr:translocation/assembly module TamB domain-containing protein [Thermus islandicus]